MRIPFISAIAASALALGGCAYNGLGFGLGYGNGYGTYGYGSPYYGGYGGYGYGSPYGYYGSRYYSPYYGGFGMPYYGWYNGFYYPGSGLYVYDSYRRPFLMTTSQRSYWLSRQPTITTTTRTVQPNWSTFERRSTLRAERQSLRDQRRSERQTTRSVVRQSTHDTDEDRPRRRR